MKFRGSPGPVTCCPVSLQPLLPDLMWEPFFLFSSQTAGAGSASSQRLCWKTIIQLFRTPSMKAGMWRSVGKGGPSKPRGQGRTKERSTSSRGSTQAHLPSPTWTRANILSLSGFQPHAEQSATGNHPPFPNTTTERTGDRYKKEPTLFLYIFMQNCILKYGSNIMIVILFL